jgi:hypothetical protein
VRSKDGLTASCKACKRAEESASYAQRKESDADWVRTRRDRHLRLNYGIGLDEYEAMYRAQDGRCASCGEFEETLRVDHDHETGVVRELLCHPCNVLEGHMLVRGAAVLRYMRKHGVLVVAEV